MTRVLSLILLSLFLLSSPALAQEPAQDKDPLGRLILTVSTPKDPRLYSVVVFDPATKEVETLFQGAESTGYVAIGISPNSKVLAVMGSGGKQTISFHSLADPKQAILTLKKDHIWPVFLDDKTIVVAGPPAGGKRDGVSMVLKKVDLASGEEVEMREFSSDLWDDVPLTLSPDRKRVTYYRRGNEKPGLFLFDLEKGTESPLSEGGTFFTWLPDSKHGYMFHKKELTLKLVKLLPGKPVEVVSDLGKGSVIGTQLKKGELLFTRFLKGAKGRRPKGLAAVHLDQKTSLETELSAKIPLDEFSLLRAFVRLQSTDWFVFAEAEGGGEDGDLRKAPRQLVQARVVGGKLERVVLLKGQGTIGFPISIR